MDQVIAGVVLLALVPVLWWLMLRGWRHRERQQSGLPAPGVVTDTAWTGEVPQGSSGAAPLPTVTGTYVSTVLAGRPLERVVAHGLGTRSLVEVALEPSAPPAPPGAPAAPLRLVLRRPGAASFFVPAADLLGVHRARGQAGKVMFGKEDLVVISWLLGGTELETAVRTKPQQDAPRLVALVQRALPATAKGSGEAA